MATGQGSILRPNDVPGADPEFNFYFARYIDWAFTTPTIILQPLTGFWLISIAGYPLTSSWILWSIVLYLARPLAAPVFAMVRWLSLTASGHQVARPLKSRATAQTAAASCSQA